MQIDDYPVFKVENVRKHTVIQLRRKDFKETNRTELTPHAECAPVAKTERGRGDKVLCRKPRRYKPVPREAERLALRVENPMQYVQAFLSVHGAGCYAKHLKIIEYVGFDTGKTCFCRRKIVRFNGKGNVLAFFQSVVAFFKLVFQHIRVLPADRVKSVVLRRNFDSRLCLFLSCALIDERELHQNGSVKVVEKIAPVFKNGGLIICLCKLIVNIFKDKAFTVFLFRYPANPVRVHLQVGNGLLCGVGLPVALCRLYHGGDFFLFCAGQLTLHGIFYRAGHGFSFCH